MKVRHVTKREYRQNRLHLVASKMRQRETIEQYKVRLRERAKS